MAGDIILQLRDARYPGQLEMRLAAADEIELLRSKCQVAVNSHDALVKALEEIRAHALAYVSDADAVEWCHSIHEVAERALAGAVGGAANG